jgi:hypothetical protein
LRRWPLKLSTSVRPSSMSPDIEQYVPLRLFANGPAHVLGAECRRIEGCPDKCEPWR